MKSTEIRQRFLKFFEERGHAILPSSSLIPENDSSVLFNTAGMQPLVPYLLGQKHPLGTRLANFQKCVRTVDLESIGDNTHATFFEMMGNWSLGDYFKNEAINWSFELLTDKNVGFGLDPNRLYVTCFEGDENAVRDNESAKIWQEIFDKNGLTGNRVFFLPAEKNWWAAGEDGPCGPDTEMFYDLTGKLTNGLSHEEFLAADEKQELVEIWNDVFMEFLKEKGQVVGKLANKNVDTGSGFERVAMVLQNKNNIYDTDIFSSIMDFIKKATGENYNEKSARIIADHIRSSVMLINDGAIPGNKDQGYILRRFIRRSTLKFRQMSVLPLLEEEKSGSLFYEIIKETYKFYNDTDYLKIPEEKTYSIIFEEEIKFRKTLERGLKEFNKWYSKTEVYYPKCRDKNIIEVKKRMPGFVAFELFTTYGFPLELIVEIANDNKIEVDVESFNEEFKKHQELSRAGADQKFKGGMGDASEQSIKYHTATHLLHQALHEVLGDHVSQKGSNITPERLRFDFTHTEKMTDEQKQRVEDIVNQKITEALPVNVVTLPKAEAEKTGARHFFGEKYPDEVTVYYIGDSIENAFSKEFCGGPHVKNTSELGLFKIKKEEAVSAGVRRIKATLS